MNGFFGQIGVKAATRTSGVKPVLAQSDALAYSMQTGKAAPHFLRGAAKSKYGLRWLRPEACRLPVSRTERVPDR